MTNQKSSFLSSKMGIPVFVGLLVILSLLLAACGPAMTSGTTSAQGSTDSQPASYPTAMPRDCGCGQPDLKFVEPIYKNWFDGTQTVRFKYNEVFYVVMPPGDQGTIIELTFDEERKLVVYPSTYKGAENDGVFSIDGVNLFRVERDEKTATLHVLDPKVSVWIDERPYALCYGHLFSAPDHALLRVGGPDEECQMWFSGPDMVVEPAGEKFNGQVAETYECGEWGWVLSWKNGVPTEPWPPSPPEGWEGEK